MQRDVSEDLVSSYRILTLRGGSAMGVGEIGGALGSSNLEISSPLTAMKLFKMTPRYQDLTYLSHAGDLEWAGRLGGN